jgi:hypothetical protein
MAGVVVTMQPTPHLLGQVFMRCGQASARATAQLPLQDRLWEVLQVGSPHVGPVYQVLANLLARGACLLFIEKEAHLEGMALVRCPLVVTLNAAIVVFVRASVAKLVGWEAYEASAKAFVQLIEVGVQLPRHARAAAGHRAQTQPPKLALEQRLRHEREL